MAYNTGARVSELTALRVRDVLLESQSALHFHGKGRKQRVIPLWANTAAELRAWLRERNRRSRSPVFPNRNGTAMSRSGCATGSTVPWRRPSKPVRRYAVNGSHRTRFGTRPPFTSWSRAPIWP